MDLTPLALSGCLLGTPRDTGAPPMSAGHRSPKDAVAQAIGHPVELTPGDGETVRRGAVRGIRWADVPPGEATYLSCPSGAVLAVAVDLRVGSLTFGEYAAAELDDVRGRALYVGPGLGHGSVALSDVAVVMSWRTAVGPVARRTVHPLDPGLALPWSNGERPDLSAEDDTHGRSGASGRSGRVRATGHGRRLARRPAGLTRPGRRRPRCVRRTAVRS